MSVLPFVEKRYKDTFLFNMAFCLEKLFIQKSVFFVYDMFLGRIKIRIFTYIVLVFIFLIPFSL